MTDAQKLKFQEEQKKFDAKNQQAINNDVSGIIYVKAEWKGEGPEMPPMRSENMFKMSQI